jgi:hypothetical protein
MEANLRLTREEHDRLLALGYVEIDDPERGHIKVRMEFNKSLGINNKRLVVKVVRGGEALTGDRQTIHAARKRRKR